MPLTADELRGLVSYDETTGKFFWLDGTPLKNYIHTRGYLYTKIRGNRYLTHRLAWLYVNGDWPSQIDHINRNKTDNRIANLRVVTSSENNKNRGLFRKNVSGYTGVTWHKERKKWRAIAGKKFVGLFDDPHEAATALKNHTQTQNVLTSIPNLG